MKVTKSPKMSTPLPSDLPTTSDRRASSGDESDQGWRPPNTEAVNWVRSQIDNGASASEFLQMFMPNIPDAVLDAMDEQEKWRAIMTLLTDPPRRKKLDAYNTLDDAVELIRNSKKIIVLTGAGVSVTCGIPDFRSKNGVYARLHVDYPDLPDPQAMFDIDFFRKNPRPFFSFAKEIYPGEFTPARSHRFIAALETRGKLLRNYTQNIDTLEQVAGIRRLVQCHGSFASATCCACGHKCSSDEIREDVFAQRIPYCVKCHVTQESKAEATTESNCDAHSKTAAGATTDATIEATTNATVEATTEQNNEATTNKTVGATTKTAIEATTKTAIEATTEQNNEATTNATLEANTNEKPCARQSIMKPDIVFFGESLPTHFHEQMTTDKDEVDLLIVMGSSMRVRPVALIPGSVQQEWLADSIPPTTPQIFINNEALTHITPDIHLIGDCDYIVRQLCQRLGEGFVEEDDVMEAESLVCVDEASIDYVNDWRRPRVTAMPVVDNAEEVDGVVEKKAKLHEAEDSNSIDVARLIIDCVPAGSYVLQAPNRNIFHGAKTTKRLPGDVSTSSSSSSSSSSDSSTSGDNDDNGSLPELNESAREIEEETRSKSA